MERCTCDDSPGLQHREAWQWGVCGDNLKYSTRFLKKFLGQKRVSKDLRAQIDTHNINVGTRVRCFGPYIKKDSTWNVISSFSVHLADVSVRSRYTYVPWLLYAASVSNVETFSRNTRR